MILNFSEPFTSISTEEEEYESDMVDIDSEEILQKIQQLENVDDLDDEAEPFNVWCACHRLQLVARDVVTNDEIFQKLRKVI